MQFVVNSVEYFMEVRSFFTQCDVTSAGLLFVFYGGELTFLEKMTRRQEEESGLKYQEVSTKNG